MPNAFKFNVSPFDCLTAEQQQLVRDSVDIDYVREGAAMLSPGEAPSHLYVIIKGYVQQWDGDELVATYGPDDCFDGRALVAGKASSRFVAAEEVLAYRLAKAAVNDLISENATFGALLFADLSKKLAALAESGTTQEMQSLTMARVDQAAVRPAQEVDASTDIVSVVKLLNAQRSTNVLVRERGSAALGKPDRLGIFTNAGLQRAILSGEPLDKLPVGGLSSFPLVTAKPSDPLYDALATMIRHRIQRVVVMDETDPDKVVGVLEQIDLLSFLSNHSYLVARQIVDAQSLEELQAAAAQITVVIGLLHRGGTRVALIARLVQELNAQLFERAWQLIAPPDLVANSCLFVMGSEGRGEQLLKTDQDNGLILRDGYTPPTDLHAICDRFSAALTSFGYPECPGRIMVNNPEWRHTALDFADTARYWLLKPSAESLMALAIFIDAHVVSGDASLLAGVREAIFQLVNGNEPLQSRFTAAISAFDSAQGWWSRLFTLEEDREQLDLKKAGIFPLVHGVRSLALTHRVRATSTLARIEALVAAGALTRAVATDLTESLHFFMTLKLKLGLAALDAGRKPESGVDIEKMSSLDRDLLKDTLNVVKRFKQLLRQRFHLDNI